MEVKPGDIRRMESYTKTEDQGVSIMEHYDREDSQCSEEEQ